MQASAHTHTLRTYAATSARPLASGRAEFGPSKADGAKGELLCLGEGGDSLQVAAKEGGVAFLLIAGKPIGEPCVQYG